MINHLFLPVEFRFRELDSRLLIALSVISKKTNTLKVFIGERESLEKYKKSLDNKKMNNIVVHKGLISDLYYFYQLYKSNTLLVILDEEGGVYSNFIKNGWPRGGKNNLYWKYVSCVFFWGVEAKNFYIKYNQNLQGIDNIVSGTPRFDLPK